MKKIFVTLLAAAALVACNKNETSPVEPQGDDIIRFSTNFQTYTVKSTALDNQTVKIVAGAPITQTVTATAADNKLTPATEMHWIKDQTSATTFTSVYPADIELTAAGKIEDYDLLYNNAQDFEYHSAVLTAAAKDVAPKTTVNLEYKHPFSMLLVTVDNQLEGTPAIGKVNVSNVALQGTFDLAGGTVTPATALAAADATLKEGKYGVIIVPQSAKPVLTVTVGEKTYKFVLNAAVDFKANKRYNTTIVIKDNTPVIEEGEAVAFGFTVADWEDAEEAINYVDISEQWSVIGNIQGTAWDTDIVMAEGTTPGVLEAEITYKAGEEFKLRKAASWDVSAGLKDGVTTVGDDAWDGFLTTSDHNIKLAAAGVYTLAFNPTTWAFTATKTGDVAPEPAAETVSLTVNVYNGAGWENVKLYAWNGSTILSAAWPGNAPEATDVVVNENHFKSFVFAEWPKDVETCQYILNDGGTNQTADLPCGDVKQDATIYLWLKADKSVEFIADPKNFDPTATTEPETGKLTLNVYNGAGWENINLYMWKDVDPWPNYTGAWTGMDPAATDVVVNEVTYKSFVVENLPLNDSNLKYILNDKGSNQTANIDLAALTAAETTMYVNLKANKSVEVIADPATFSVE